MFFYIIYEMKSRKKLIVFQLEKNKFPHFLCLFLILNTLKLNKILFDNYICELII